MVHHAITYSLILFSATGVLTHASSLEVSTEATKSWGFPSLEQIELSEQRFRAAEAARHAQMPVGISFWPYFVLTLIVVMFVALVISVFLASVVNGQDMQRTARGPVRIPRADAKMVEPQGANASAGSGPGMPLYDKLRVPVGHHLDVKFPNAPSAQRQSALFGVTSIDGVSLFQISISELGGSQGIHLEKLNGETLATLSTEQLWQKKGTLDGLDFHYHWGGHYATLMPLQDEQYQVVRQGRRILSIKGRFPQDSSPCEVEALDSDLEVAARIRTIDNNQSFHVTIYSAQDAGLVILSFLGILKMRACL